MLKRDVVDHCVSPVLKDEFLFYRSMSYNLPLIRIYLDRLAAFFQQHYQDFTTEAE